jgi:hypothetical protein
MTSLLATRGALIAVPSPLEGEGYPGLSARSDWVRGILRQMLFLRRDPLTLLVMLHDHAALSLKGRGHSNARLGSEEAAQ